MLYKKLKKDIVNKSITRIKNVDYNGISPIIVDNDNNTISIDLSNTNQQIETITNNQAELGQQVQNIQVNVNDHNRDIANILNTLNTNGTNIINLDERVNTNYQNIENLTNNLNNIVNRDNVWSANNTFNNPISFGDKALLKNGTNPTLIEITNNSQKRVNLDFIQSNGTYQNYYGLNFRFKHLNKDMVEGLNIYVRPNDNEGVWITTIYDKFYFNKPIQASDPTQDSHLATKQYVDSKVGSVNLQENVEVQVPNYTILNKPVFKKFCTTIQQITQTLSSLDVLVDMSGMVKTNSGTFRQAPFHYSANEKFIFDTGIDTKLASEGNSADGHKIILTYTKIND